MPRHSPARDRAAAEPRHRRIERHHRGLSISYDHDGNLLSTTTPFPASVTSSATRTGRTPSSSAASRWRTSPTCRASTARSRSTRPATGNMCCSTISRTCRRWPQGETVTDSFQVRVTDEHGAFDTKTVNVTVTGTNDAPVITSAVTVGSVTEDDPRHQSATGTLTATDVDHGAVKTWNVAGVEPGSHDRPIRRHHRRIQDRQDHQRHADDGLRRYLHRYDSADGAGSASRLHRDINVSSPARTAAPSWTTSTQASDSAVPTRRWISPVCRPAPSATGRRSERISIPSSTTGAQERNKLHDQRRLRPDPVRGRLWHPPRATRTARLSSRATTYVDFNVRTSGRLVRPRCLN